jgi:hypothetical protein
VRQAVTAILVNGALFAVRTDVEGHVAIVAGRVANKSGYRVPSAALTNRFCSWE